MDVLGISMTKELNANIWVEASAGTGKTKALIDRIITLLLYGVNPSEILCITFTNAAASEMQLRLHQIISDIQTFSDKEIDNFIEKLGIKVDLDDAKDRCRKLYDIIIDDSVNIQTIHSLCLSIIKRFPVVSGVYNVNSIIDDNESLSLLDRAINNVLSTKHLDPLLDECINFLGNNIDVMLIQDMLSRQTFHKDEYLRVFENGLETLAEKYANFFGIKIDDILEFTSDKSELILKNLPLIDQDIQELITAISGIDEEKLKDLSNKLSDIIPVMKNKILSLTNIFLTQTESPRKNLISKKLSEAYPDIAVIVEKITNNIAWSVEISKKITHAQISFASTLFAANVISKYEEVKKLDNVIEYDDILFKAREILSSHENEWEKFKITNTINHILIDEAQDTNKIQWDIVKLLTEDFYTGESYKNSHSLFVVGDAKQSIYSFQGADVSHFIDTKNYFKEKAENSGSQLFLINKNTSYRSTPLILHYVDKVFSDNRLMASLKSNNIRHIPSRTDRSSEIEIWPLEEVPYSEFPKGWEAPIRIKESTNPNIKLASKIAQTVAAKIKANLYIPSKKRNIQPGDFLILFQRRTELMFHILKALKNEGIPVAGIDKLAFTEHIAVQDIISLCRFVLFPYDNLNLATLLKSPFFSIQESELLDLCQNTSWESPIFDKLASYNPKIYGYLEKFIKLSKEKSPYEFLSYIIEKERYRQLLVERLGHETNEILDELLSYTYEFESTEKVPDLFNFLYLLQTKNLKTTTTSNNENAVKLMTVHASKGLQSPCVILADSTTYIQKIDNYIWRDIMFFYPNSQSAPRELLDIRNEEIKKKNDEYYRLLYVAITRAQDALYICGIKPERSLNENCWYNVLLRAMKESRYSNNFSEIFDGYTFKLGHLDRVKNQSVTVQPTKKPIKENIWLKPRLQIEKYPTIFQSIETLRGMIIHEILSKINEDTINNIDYIINDILLSSKSQLSCQDTDLIKNSAIRIINNPELQWIFSRHSFSEVPFILKYNNGLAREGRIDKIIINEGSISVIEIKTQKDTGNISSRILEQLKFYKEFLVSTYPSYTIKTFILWVDSIRLEEITL